MILHDCTAWKYVLLLPLTLLAGCGSGHPDLIKVSGIVTFQGKPMEGVEVVFHNDQSPRAPVGVTDAEGRFQLTTFENNDGAMAGSYVVTVSKNKSSAELSSADAADPSAAYGQGMMAAASGNMDAVQQNELPAKYANRNSSGLTFEVSDSSTEFQIDLE